MNRIRNKYIRGTPHVRCFGDKGREDRWRWFGHVKGNNSDCFDNRVLRVELPANRFRGRPERRFMDVVKKDMKVVRCE